MNIQGNSKLVIAISKFKLKLMKKKYCRLICRANWQSIFLQNNEEYPIESIKDANFTQSTYKAMKKANLMEVYSLQSYAW